MKKNRKVSGTAADGTLPKTPIEISGKTYDLCFDFAAMGRAETAINVELARAGSRERVNLLIALAELNLMSTPVLFAAALRTFHPEIGFRDAQAMVTPQNVFEVAGVIQDAWRQATPESEANPPQAQTSA